MRHWINLLPFSFSDEDETTESFCAKLTTFKEASGSVFDENSKRFIMLAYG